MGCCGWKETDREPTVPPAPAPGLRVVERHRARAESDLTAAAGGASLCRTDGTPDAKRAEGALAAIAQLHRAAKREPTADPRGAANELLTTWLADRAAATDMGPDWRAYRDGGVAGLRAVLVDLDQQGS